MKTRETLLTSCFFNSLYKYVLMILAALLFSSCALMGRIGNSLGLGIYDDYSTKPLEYDQQYKALLEAITDKSKKETDFEKLAEKDLELQKARKDYKKCKAELTEAETRLNEREKMREKAREDVDTTKNALEKAIQEKDVAKQNELNQKLKEYTAVLTNVEDEYKKASGKREELDGAVRATEVRVAKLQGEIDKLKAQRDGFVDRKCWDGSPLNPDEKTLCAYQRNILIGNLIAISDGMCEKHMKTILGNEAAVNIITGTLTNAFSGAATVVTGGMSKTILAALAFFSNSERSLFNETIYKSVLVPAIIKKINETRLNVRRDIMAKYETNKNAAYEDYPVNFALADIIKYHQSCSFMVGLQKALEEGTQTAPGQDRASLEQKLKTLVHERDGRIRELREAKKDITDEDIKKDNYIIYLDDQIRAITKKLGEPEAKKPEDAMVTALRKAKDGFGGAKATMDDIVIVVNKVTKLDKEQLFVDVSLKKGDQDVSSEDARTITGGKIKQALLKLPVASGLKEDNIVIEKCQPSLQPEAKKPEDAEMTALRKAKDGLKGEPAQLGDIKVVVNSTKLDEANKKLFIDVSLKKDSKEASEEDVKTITRKDIEQALLKLKDASGLKEGSIVIEKCQPPLQKGPK